MHKKKFLLQQPLPLLHKSAVERFLQYSLPREVCPVGLRARRSRRGRPVGLAIYAPAFAGSPTRE